MSADKNKKEADRWHKTAVDDLDTAAVLKNNNKFAYSCFHAQQAAEKSVKALWYYCDADPWGHSVKRLIDDLKQVNLELYEQLSQYSNDAMMLDRFYIPTRYPNGLPELTPAEAFNLEDATSCIENAEKIVNVIEKLIGGK